MFFRFYVPPPLNANALPYHYPETLAPSKHTYMDDAGVPFGAKCLEPWPYRSILRHAPQCPAHLMP